MQQDEDSIEMRAEAEAQARSAQFLFANVAKYFPSSFTDTHSNEGQQREMDRAAEAGERREWGW